METERGYTGILGPSCKETQDPYKQTPKQRPLTHIQRLIYQCSLLGLAPAADCATTLARYWLVSSASTAELKAIVTPIYIEFDQFTYGEGTGKGTFKILSSYEECRPIMFLLHLLYTILSHCRA